MTPEPSPLPLLSRGDPRDLLYVILHCDDADVPEILAWVDRCHAGNAQVGNA